MGIAEESMSDAVNLKRRCMWAQKDMDAALAECREGGKSVTEAAYDNNIPMSTLGYRLQGKIFNQVNNCVLGGPKVFVSFVLLTVASSIYIDIVR